MQRKANCTHVYNSQKKNRESYARNRERRIASVARWRKENREKYRITELARLEREADRLREYRRQYYEQHKDKINRYATQWGLKTRAGKVFRHINRARRRKKGDHWTPEDIVRIRLQQNNRCANPYCLTELTNFHKDHIVPVARGGSQSVSNIQLLCPPCNHRKWAKSMDLFLQEECKRRCL